MERARKKLGSTKGRVTGVAGAKHGSAAGLAQKGVVPASDPKPVDTATDGETAASVESAMSNPAAAEVSKAFAHFQEELFGQLRVDVIEPLLVIRDFLENREPIATGEHGLKVMKILDGIYRSAATGREVRYRVR